jgi:hypothetical protein
MPEQEEPSEPVATTEAEQPKYDPGPEFKEKVKEVLEELGVIGGNVSRETSEPAKPKRRTLRDEEIDSETLVNKVLDKLEKMSPPEKPKPEKVEPETPPGPEPKKRKVQSALWGA